MEVIQRKRGVKLFIENEGKSEREQTSYGDVVARLLAGS